VLLVGRVPLQRRQQREPGERAGAERGLPDTRREVDRLVRTVPDLVPLALQQLREGTGVAARTAPTVTAPV
jgi:hypothetical protein